MIYPITFPCSGISYFLPSLLAGVELPRHSRLLIVANEDSDMFIFLALLSKVSRSGPVSPIAQLKAE